MIRVLHVVGSMDRAGAETMIMNLYRNIDRSKVQFDFLYFKAKRSDYDNEIEELGGVIYRIVTNSPLERFIRTYTFLNTSNYKIVQAHTLFNVGFNLLAARLATVPMRIAHAHSSSSSRSGALARCYKSFSRFLIEKFSTHFIACGEAAGKFLFSSQKFTIIPNSIDVEYFYKIAKTQKYYIDEKFSLNKSTLKLIQVGRLQKVKNHQFTIEVCKKLKTKKIDFQLYIVGQGELRDEIQNSINVLGLQDDITLLGVRDDVAQLMAGADIHLMPSFHEGFPVVLVEAQAVGLPSLISSKISTEVDLGLSLVKFLNIENNFDEWVEGINFFKNRINKKTKVENLLANSQYDVKQSAKELEGFYLS